MGVKLNDCANALVPSAARPVLAAAFRKPRREKRAKRFAKAALHAVARNAVAYFFTYRKADAHPLFLGARLQKHELAGGCGFAYAVYIAKALVAF